MTRVLPSLLLFPLLLPATELAAQEGPRRATVQRGRLRFGAFAGSMERTGAAVVSAPVLSAETTTSLTLLHVLEEGTHVRRGEVIGRLDTSGVEERLLELQVEELTARAAIEEAREDVAWAERRVELLRLEHDLARRRGEARRLEIQGRLAELGEPSESWDEARRRAWELARRRWDLELEIVALEQTLVEERHAFDRRAAVRELRERGEALAGLEAEHERCRHAVEDCRKVIEECELVAPRDGLLLAPPDSEWGLLVGDILRPGQPIAIVCDPQSRTVVVSLPVVLGEQVALGAPARVRIPGGRSLEGRVASWTPPSGSALAWGGGTPAGHLGIALAGNSDVRLLPDLAVEVELGTLSLEDVLVVPTWAIRADARGVYCTALVEGKPVRRDVRIGLRDAERVVILEGLEEGESVLESNS